MFRAAISIALALAILAGPGMCCCTAMFRSLVAKQVKADSARHCCAKPAKPASCCEPDRDAKKPTPKRATCSCCVKPDLTQAAAAYEIDKPEPALLFLLPLPASVTSNIDSTPKSSRPPPHLSMKRFIEDFCHILRC